MRTVASLAELTAHAGPERVALACGVFDGVHLGHQAIVHELVGLAGRTGATPVIVTFDPHPRAVLHPHAAPALLSTAAQKERWFAEHGVTAMVVLPFSAAMAALSPREFLLTHLQAAGMTVTGVCVGNGWRFGARGAGDTVLLADLGRELGFETRCVPEVIYYGEPVSSTRIRRALAHGNLPLAHRMLGRDYAVEGVVEHGKGIGGKDLECPTANVSAAGKVLPPFGVYAAFGTVSPERGDSGARRFGGVAYVGHAPTIPEADGKPSKLPRLEFHLFDYRGDLYGLNVEVEFTEFIRPDEVFPTVADLRRQLDLDLARARTVTGSPAASASRAPSQLA